MSESISSSDLDALRNAVASLEHPSLVARLTSMVGRPIDLVGATLPKQASQAIAVATTKGLGMALKVTMATIKNEPQKSAPLLHKALAIASGAAGGAFGLSALPVELPVSTVIMMRSIVDVARSQGEDLTKPHTALSCLEVFALGGRTDADDAAEAGYFVVRGVLARSVTEAARFIAERGALEEGAPVLVRLVAQIGARFGAVVTEKAVAQAIPIIGALGGAAVNYAFIQHFQAIALSHFTVRRLERVYGPALVRAAYDQLVKESKAAA
jgi:EcsC protein family